MKRVLLLVLLLTGCHRGPLNDGEVLGAEDFVMDSYALVEEGTGTQVGSSHKGVMVAGAVNKEGVVLIKDHFLPLRDVLIQAGGILTSGDRSKIYILRQGEKAPRIYAIRLEHLARLPAASLLAIPGDIVFVSTKPLYQWKEQVLDLFKGRGP